MNSDILIKKHDCIIQNLYKALQFSCVKYEYFIHHKLCKFMHFYLCQKWHLLYIYQMPRDAVFACFVVIMNWNFKLCKKGNLFRFVIPMDT